MKREIIDTADGSKTIHLPDWNENYHSHHGAKQEAEHVFIAAGLKHFEHSDKLSVLEVGFGTGLNAWLSAIKAKQLAGKIEYHGVEAYPVSEEELAALDYGKLTPEHSALYTHIHQADWNIPIDISNNFQLTKWKTNLESFEAQENQFQLVYFDAFGPRVQSELWETPIFEKIHRWLASGGCLVTYCAKGQVKRNLKAAGFIVEALPGPPGKREMTRAWKR